MHRWKAGIINADVAQMYTAFSVGTAKPICDSRRGALFDVSSEAQNLNAMDFRKNVEREGLLLEGCGEMPLVVGGAFFYIKQLLFVLKKTITSEYASSDLFQGNLCQDKLQNKPNKLCNKLEEYSNAQLFELLKSFDEERALKIGDRDRYRLSRALDIIERQGDVPSCFKQIFAPIAKKIKILAILPERELLRLRVSERLDEMLGSDGGAWLAEIKKLQASDWEVFVKKKGFLGYTELFAWVQRGCLLHELVEVKQSIIIKTRQYIKKQLCFWRGLKRQIIEEDKEKTVDIVELSTIEHIESLMQEFELVER